MIVSQYKDVVTNITAPGYGANGSMGLVPINQYIQDHFGFRTDFMGPVAGVLIAFTVFFAFLFAYCIKTLNFQMR